MEESAKNQEKVVKECLEEYKTILYKIATDMTFIEYAEQMDNSTQKDWLVPREKIEGIFENNIYTYDKVQTFSFVETFLLETLFCSIINIKYLKEFMSDCGGCR